MTPTLEPLERRDLLAGPTASLFAGVLRLDTHADPAPNVARVIDLGDCVRWRLDNDPASTVCGVDRIEVHGGPLDTIVIRYGEHAPPPASMCLVAHVLTPPGLRWIDGKALAPRLLGADRDAALALPGVRAVVVRNQFAGVVAESDALAATAARALQARWSAPPRADEAPVSRRTIAQRGDAIRALASAATRHAQHYQWPLAGTRTEAS